jgi:flagellar biosynthesis component FlhA
MVAIHDCAAVAALRAAYVKPVLRSTKTMMTLSLPPPFPATLLMKMLPTLKMMPKKKTPAAPAAATDAETKHPETKKNTETQKAETKTDTKTVAEEDEDDDETTMKLKLKPAADEEDEDKTMKKMKKKMEVVPTLKDPDHDTGVSPVDTPGDPRMEGTSFHLPSPTALPLQGPFPGD